MAFKLNITNVCKDCYREIPFDIRTDGMPNSGDIEFEVQSGMCEECLKELKEKTIEEITKKLTETFQQSFIESTIENFLIKKKE
jgi:hypothetical protein